ncbi:MAG: hypothetical protein FJY17_09875 [Bacteroidetes bacterium]|nr:hypothetical protein [Bacteroidota bacterium]MBM3419210.1 hypothetical protein [Bacteroidota bacterium]
MSFPDPYQLDDNTKLLHIKEQIMEIKLQLAKLAIQKEEVISKQYYEKASELRMEEKHLINLLMEQRLVLIRRQTGLEPTEENLKIQAMCQEVLREISTVDESKTFYQELFQEFRVKLLQDCEELTQRKNDCLAAQNFVEANVLRDHIFKIGDFLAKHSGK